MNLIISLYNTRFYPESTTILFCTTFTTKSVFTLFWFGCSALNLCYLCNIVFIENYIFHLKRNIQATAYHFIMMVSFVSQMDRINNDAQLESRQIKLCATCFDLYHGLARALEMTLNLDPLLLTKPEACDKQNELLLGRTCQVWCCC